MGEAKLKAESIAKTLHGAFCRDVPRQELLQLAAEKGRSWAIAFRPLAARRQNSAAALRLELHSNGEGTRVHILKSRGGRPTVLNNLI